MTCQYCYISALCVNRTCNEVRTFPWTWGDVCENPNGEIVSEQVGACWLLRITTLLSTAELSSCPTPAACMLYPDAHRTFQKCSCRCEHVWLGQSWNNYGKYPDTIFADIFQSSCPITVYSHQTDMYWHLRTSVNIVISVCVGVIQTLLASVTTTHLIQLMVSWPKKFDSMHYEDFTNSF